MESSQKTGYSFTTQNEAEKKKNTLPPEENLHDLADFFKTFGDGTRLRILFLLSQGELCVSDLAMLMNMTHSAISHQLKFLKNNQLVRYRRQGKTLFYALADEHVHRITEIGLEHVQE